MKNEIDMTTLEGFFYKDAEPVVAKMNSFAVNGADTTHLLLDFDRTLTLGSNSFGENISTWELLRRHLNNQSQCEYSRLYNIYRAKEVEGKMTLEDAVFWWESILRLFVNNRLRWKDIDFEVSERMPIRPHVQDFFELCKQKHLPTIIISAGLKDVIKLWCNKHRILPSKILSTELTFSPEGVITGWQKDSLVHVLNKHEKGHRDINILRKSHPNTILIGDSASDAAMVDGDDNILRILINDPRHDDKITEVSKVPPQFDLMTRDCTFLSVLKLVAQITSS